MRRPNGTPVLSSCPRYPTWTTSPYGLFRDTMNVIPGLSDHDIVKCVVDTKPSLAKKSPTKTYLHRKADWDSLRVYMKDFCNSFVLSYEGTSVETLWLEFKEALNYGIQKFIHPSLLARKSTCLG